MHSVTLLVRAVPLRPDAVRRSFVSSVATICRWTMLLHARRPHSRSEAFNGTHNQRAACGHEERVPPENRPERRRIGKIFGVKRVRAAGRTCAVTSRIPHPASRIAHRASRPVGLISFQPLLCEMAKQTGRVCACVTQVRSIRANAHAQIHCVMCHVTL